MKTRFQSSVKYLNRGTARLKSLSEPSRISSTDDIRGAGFEFVEIERFLPKYLGKAINVRNLHKRLRQKKREQEQQKNQRAPMIPSGLSPISMQCSYYNFT